MDHKEEIKKELEELSPFLSELKKENPFKVPVNYFEQLPDQIMEQARLTPVEREPVKTSWLDRLIAPIAFLLRPQVAFAAVCLVALTWTGIYLMKPADTPALASDTFEEVANEYIAANIDDFDTELLGALAMNDSDVFTTEETTNQLMDADFEMNEELMDEILEEFEDVELEELL